MDEKITIEELLKKWQKVSMEALADSIEHWKRCRNDELKDGEEMGIKDCACCQAFYSDGFCTLCPIMLRTGATCCEGTPYEEAHEAWEDLHNEGEPLDADARESVIKMISYLKETRELVGSGDLKPDMVDLDDSYDMRQRVIEERRSKMADGKISCIACGTPCPTCEEGR